MSALIARRIGAVAVAVACAFTATAAAAPSAEDAADRARRLDREDRALTARLDAARAALTTARARNDMLQERFATEAAVVTARLRALYAAPPESPVLALITGQFGLAQAQADFQEAANRADVAMLAAYKVAIADARAAERDAERTKRALAGSQRLLDARRARARAELAAAERRATAPVLAGRDSATPVASVSPVPGQGLPEALLRSRRLPGAPPVDAATGAAVATAPPALAVVPGPDGRPAIPAPAEPYTGPRRRTFVAGVMAAGGGYRTAVGVPYDPTAMVAVHRTLPLGSTVLLRHGSLTVQVRIVDRGPYRTDRDLEVSPQAASALAVTGSTRLTGEVLG